MQKFICDCGNIKIISHSSVRHGNSKSCGCLHKEIVSLPFNVRLRNIWKLMLRRCNNPSSNRYKNYAGRGITVCENWTNNYQDFETWAFNNGYQDHLTIERKNNDKGYYPENCTWIPLSEQAKNRTTNLKRKNDEDATNENSPCY